MSSYDHGKLSPPPPPRKRKSRAKSNIVWLKVENTCTEVKNNEEIVAKHYSSLSPQELHVAALVKSGLPSWKIAELLVIGEHAVEKYRSAIRKCLGLPHEANLHTYLKSL